MSLSCSYCPKTFGSEGSRLQHTRSAHPVVCSYCEFSAGLEEDLEAHIRQAHPSHCPYCESSFASADELAGHVEKLHPLCCDYCTYQTVQINEIEGHLKEAHPHACTYCVKSFKTDRDLNNHESKVHSDKFICTVCHVHFDEEKDVVKHVEVHSLFCCHGCDGTFPTREERKDHYQREHREGGRPERPQPVRSVPCELCHKKFTSEIGLRRHTQAVHEEPALEQPEQTEDQPAKRRQNNQEQ